MNKQTLERQWKYFRMVLGVSRRLVDQIPEAKLDYRPSPEVRTAGELVAHTFTYLTESVATVAAGKQVDPGEPKFSGKVEMMAWIDKQIETAFAGFESLTDTQLAAKIVCWGETFHGWQLLDFAYQEHLHHRGQLTVYLRLMGIAPIFIYDFGAEGH